MAKGTDPEDFVLCSRVRTGLKREFAFALKAQAEIRGSLGRTRARRPPNSGLCPGGIRNSLSKRLKTFESKEVKNESENDEGLGLVKDQARTDIENPGVEQASTRSDALISIEATTSDSLLRDDNGNENLEQKPDCISEEEPESDVLDTASDDELKNHLLGSVSIEELKDDTMRPVSDDGPRSNSMRSTIDEEQKNHIAESAKESEETNDSAIVLCAEELKGDHVNEDNLEMFLFNEELTNKGRKIQVSEECSAGETALVDNSVKIEDDIVEKPLTQFSGPILKPKLTPVEVLAVKNGMEDIKAVEFDDSNENTLRNSLLTLPPRNLDVVTSPLLTPQMKQDFSASRTVKLSKCVTRLRDLLDTGILEGLPVQYRRGSRVRAPNETGLFGVIKNCGILCHCGKCKGIEVITPNQFELHAGSSNKRPPEYIYLQNGSTLRDILNACKNVPPVALETIVLNAICCSPVIKTHVCLNCKGPIPNTVTGDAPLLCGSCVVLKDSQVTTSVKTNNGSRMLNSGLSSKSTPTSVLSKNSTAAGSRIQGRLTRKDLRLHKLVFEDDVLPDGTEVAYYARRQKLLVGYKQGFGILCTCCNSEVSPSQFEAHAGWASRRKPYLHIYTSNGVSLHELALSLSRGRRLSANENDDLCSACLDGGDLLCCDGCPRAFHKECISLSNSIGDKWFCEYCETMLKKERFVESNANAIAAGRIVGVDSIDQITKRCIRIVETPGAESGGCILCRDQGFSSSGFSARTVIICDQCDKEFHVGCLKERNMDDLKELPEGQWFCCVPCRTIHSTLQNLVDNGEQELSDHLLNIIKTKHQEKSLEYGNSLDIRWRLLSGKMAAEEMRPFLSKAVAIFHEQFNPILEDGTNRDFIPSMVYGRNLREFEFGNMFCAVLTVNCSVVSAGIFRIFGQEVAELPLVATASDCAGLGYFQCLFSCIEGLLGSLEVRNFLLPAAEEAESIWTKKFGFEKLSPAEFQVYKKVSSVLMFGGTSMLRKRIPRC